SRRFFGENASPEERNAKLLALLDGVTDRSARFVCVTAFASSDGHVELFEGEVHGEIAEAPRGEAGFGYDPVFVIAGDGRTIRGLARTVVGHITGNDVRMKVRHRVAKHLEVELRGTVMRLERARDFEDLAEIGRGVRIGELGEVGDVAAAPDHDRVARLTDVAANQICVGDAAREDPRISVGVVGTALGAHRTALARLALVS